MEFITKYNCVGILGGTFNPIHVGHLALAGNAIKQYSDIEQIIIMPNNLPIYKGNKEIASIEHRCSMINLAIEKEAYISMSLMEIKRGGITYTSDTLEEIKSLKSDMKIYFIIGADSLFSIKNWHNYKDVLRMCTLLVARRNSDYADMEEYAAKLIEECGCGDIRFILMDEVMASSTKIRCDISNGNIPEKMLSKGVINYIKNNKLYGCKEYES